MRWNPGSIRSLFGESALEEGVSQDMEWVEVKWPAVYAWAWWWVWLYPQVQVSV